jgi:hypothetical protein
VPIFIHSYDYVYPGNFDDSDERDPFYADKEQWIGGPMAAIGITDKGLQRQIAKCLLDQFRKLLKSLADADPRIHLVETLGTLTDVSQWNDEIHPNNEGYALIAQKFWAKIDEVLG